MGISRRLISITPPSNPQFHNTKMYEGRYRKGLGKGGRARVILAKKNKGSVAIGPKVYNFGPTNKASKEEKKFFDTALAFTFPTVATCSTSGATGNIHIVPQGDTESSREGRKIEIKSIQLRGTFSLAPGGDANGISIAYLVMILDTQCNGANPAITDVFTSNAMGSNMINLSNDNRFRILKRFCVTLNSNAGVTTAYNQNAMPLEYYMKCNIPITYDNTAATGAITTTRQNSIFFAQGSAVDNQITFDGTARIRFTG